MVQVVKSSRVYTGYAQTGKKNNNIYFTTTVWDKHTPPPHYLKVGRSYAQIIS